MKKLIAFLLVLMMMTVSLAACDIWNIFSKEEETTTAAPEETTTTAPQEEETTTPAPQEEETTTKKPWIPSKPGTPDGGGDGGDTPPSEDVTTTPLPDNAGSGELEFPQLPI